MRANRGLLRSLGGSNYVIFDRKTGSTLLCQAEPESELDTDAILQQLEMAVSNQGHPCFDARMRFSTLVLNTTEECNLRCRYCSRYKKDYAPRRMDLSTLMSCLTRAAEHADTTGDRVVVQFHGGEPSLAINDIRLALAELTALQLEKIDLRMQTNGTRVDQDLINLCCEYDIHLGFSIDGPPEINGILRRYANGKPVGGALERNLALVRKKIPRTHVSCLCVISSANVECADQVFEYVLAHGIDDISLLPLYPDYPHCLTNPCSIVPRTEEAVLFAQRIFDLWIARLRSGEHLCIPSFQIWIWNLLSTNAGHILCNSCCGVGESMLFIDTDGTAYPCGPFSYEQDMAMGNIRHCAIDRFVDSSVYVAFRDRLAANVPTCAECALQGICRGGCPANSYLHNRSIMSKDPFCEYWEGIISYILNKISEDSSLCDLIPSYTIRL